MGLFFGTVYVAISLTIAWSALKFRCQGWRTGLLYALLTLTIPGWVLGSFWLCQKAGFFQP
jgi:hypothetical protein